MSHQEWQDRELDVDFVIDSGLLFEINRSVLHLFGIGLVVKPDKTFGFKDLRVEPEKLVFDKPTLEMGTTKLRRFLKEFGHRQMDRRAKRHGQSCQWAPQ